jgi:class 3 adenylate cyclase
MSYIGQTTNLAARLRKHATRPTFTMAKHTGQYRPLTEFFRVQVIAHACSSKAANTAERKATWQHGTRWPHGYNKTAGNPAASKQVFWIRKRAGTL